MLLIYLLLILLNFKKSFHKLENEYVLCYSYVLGITWFIDNCRLFLTLRRNNIVLLLLVTLIITYSFTHSFSVSFLYLPLHNPKTKPRVARPLLYLGRNSIVSVCPNWLKQKHLLPGRFCFIVSGRISIVSGYPNWLTQKHLLEQSHAL